MTAAEVSSQDDSIPRIVIWDIKSQNCVFISLTVKYVRLFLIFAYKSMTNGLQPDKGTKLI